jgi:hypothetical protein
MKTRPWIWLIIANLLFIAGITTLVVIAVSHPQQEVPAAHGR